MIMFTVLILEDDYEQQKAVSKIINEHYKDWQIFIAPVHIKKPATLHQQNVLIFFYLILS